MNKSQLVAAYARFRAEQRLTMKQCILSAGGALLMLGMRVETEDLDLDIPEDLYDRLKRKVETQKIGKVVTTKNGTYIRIGNYSLHRGLSENIKTIIVGGICCYAPEEILKQKQNIKRPASDIAKVNQDKVDIENLESFLRKSA